MHVSVIDLKGEELNQDNEVGIRVCMHVMYVCMYVVLTVHACMYVCVEVGSHRRSGDSFDRFGRKGHFIGQLFDNGHLRC